MQIDKIFFKINSQYQAKFFLVLVFFSMISILPGALYIDVGAENKSEYLIQFGAWKYFVIIFFAPFVETLIFQYLPSFIFDKLSITNGLALTLIPIPFAISHISLPSNFYQALNGLLGGFFLGLCYLTYKNTSKIKAFFLTFFLHILHNMAGLIIILFLKN